VEPRVLSRDAATPWDSQRITEAAGTPPPPDATSGRTFDALRLSLLGTSLAAAAGAALVAAVPEGLALPGSTRLNIYFHLLSRWEPLALGALSLVALALAASGRRLRSSAGRDDRASRDHTAPDARRRTSGRLVWLLAAAVFVVGVGAAYSAHRAYPFSMDEWAPELQAKIFATGHRSAEIPETWRPYAAAATPVFVSLLDDPPRWTSTYLPVYALLKTPLVWIGATAWLNPLLGAATILMIGALARRLWPDRPLAPLVAALLLATSTQFLITSASYYTMPAHLLANVSWLWLHLHPRRSVERLTPVVGALALGLHNFVVHTLFVVPFLVRLLLRREVARALYYGAVYLAAGLGWLAWLRWAVPSLETATSRSFALPGWQAAWQQAWNLALFVGWQPIALLALAGLAIVRWRRASTLERDLALSALVTFGFYLLYTKNQGHGWSYRYVYAVLGNLALLGTAAWLQLRESAGEKRLRRLLVASTAFALLVQLPYRWFEVRTTVRPWALASRWLASNDADALVLHPALGWYAQDLVRNEPGLTNRPILLFMHRMRSTDYELLRRDMDIRVLAPGALRAFGVPASEPRASSPP
jgi:hypothetical protein